MATTIQVSEGLKEALNQRKLSRSETYEEIIMSLLEDVTEISEWTKNEIRQGEADIKAGRLHSFDEIKRRFNV